MIEWSCPFCTNKIQGQGDIARLSVVPDKNIVLKNNQFFHFQCWYNCVEKGFKFHSLIKSQNDCLICGKEFRLQEKRLLAEVYPGRSDTTSYHYYSHEQCFSDCLGYCVEEIFQGP